MSEKRHDFHSLAWRAGNAFVALLARLGVGPIHLLTTTGHRTGREATVPVVPVDDGDRRWLVAPYGEVQWVRNVRSTDRVEMRYGRTSRRYRAHEAAPTEAGPVLKRYVAIAPKARPEFDATVDDPVEAFVAEADRHPVFELLAA
ncbi:MAG: nitroreductase family deazaflavin-dependent oxidoreductase [Acidimicrobiales bacterium]|nr:nitroreductase family deazaflavin-dependent oxidoreductase [Acidimicrobiales bacterium]